MSKQPNILIVEDEDDLRKLVVETFSDAGFEVMEACNGSVASNIIQQRSDLQALLTDVHMPGGPEGIALARQVWKSRPKCVILITSGLAQPKMGDLPASMCFIRKPYRGSKLVRLIRDMMEQQAQPNAGQLPSHAAAPIEPSRPEYSEVIRSDRRMAYYDVSFSMGQYLEAAERCRQYAMLAKHSVVVNGYLQSASAYDLLARVATPDIFKSKGE